MDLDQHQIIGDDQMLPFTFDLPENSLIYVDTLIGLDSMREKLQGCILLGIDTERKPSFARNRPLHPTSIIQLATRDSSGIEFVFIIDMLVLKKLDKTMSKLNDLLGEILVRESCIKIGQGLKQDFAELRAAYPIMSAFNLINSALETHSLAKCLQPDLVQMQSLKNLVKKHLNYELLKTQQVINSPII